MNEEHNIVNEEDSSLQDTLPESDTEDAVATLSKPPQKKSAVRFVFDVVEMFAWSVLVVLLLFSFVVRLCRVEGASMENTLYEGESLLIYSLGYTPQQDDIIVFHHAQDARGEEWNDEFPIGEKAIVKRVIATAGQQVEIHFDTAKIYIDGVEYADAHKVLKNTMNHNIGKYTLKAMHSYNIHTNTFSATVPEGHVFVLGDNRNYSRDSRDPSIGFVDERCILGKAILRVAPFTVFS